MTKASFHKEIIFINVPPIFGAMMKRFLGMSPWKRTLLGCQVYTGK